MSGGIDRRQLLLGGAMLGAAGAASLLRPRRALAMLPAAGLDAIVPATIGGWRLSGTTGLIVPDRVDMTQRIYDDVLTRVYAGAGLPTMMLLVAYGSAQDTGIAIHRPEACYPSAGYRLGRRATVPLAGGPAGAAASFLTARRGGYEEQIYYWTRVGDDFPASPWAEKIDVLAANLRGVMPDGILVRISAHSSDRAGTLTQLTGFARALLTASTPAALRLFLGAPR